MKQKLHALDAFFIEKLKLSENDPDTPWKTWNRPLGSGTVGTRMILNNMKNHSREYYMTFWSSTNYSDFRTDQTHQFTTLIPTFTFTNLRPWCRPLPLPIYERFPLSISMGVACQQGTFYPSEHLVPPLFGTSACVLWRPMPPKTAMNFSTISLRISLGMFSVLLNVTILDLFCFSPYGSYCKLILILNWYSNIHLSRNMTQRSLLQLVYRSPLTIHIDTVLRFKDS